MSAPSEWAYALGSLDDFKRYLADADIKLVSPKYLKQLHAEGRVWPRRQEAELEEGALLGPSELGSHFRLLAVSHCWESREHPDPCGFQNAQIVKRMAHDEHVVESYSADGEKNCKGYVNVKSEDVYLFIDFLSLYQYKREGPGGYKKGSAWVWYDVQKDQKGIRGEEASFGRAMTAMHLFYANSAFDFSCHVWRIERLTPQKLWNRQINQQKSIRIFSEAARCVTEVPLAQLTRNCTPFLYRGWCRAELEWSLPESTDISQLQGCSCLWLCAKMPWCRNLKWFWLYAASYSSPARARLPLRPTAFREQVRDGELVFTWRADLEPVLALQKQVFNQKVATTQEVSLRVLPLDEHLSLLNLVPMYAKLGTFRMSQTYLGAASEALLRCLGARPTLRKLRFEDMPLCAGAFRVLGDCLARGDPALEVLELMACSLKGPGVAALAQGLAINGTLRELDLSFNSVGDRGAAAMADALRANDTLQKFDLHCNGIGNAGACALAGALENNTALRTLDLQCNWVGLAGARALRRCWWREVKIKEELTQLLNDDGERWSCLTYSFLLLFRGILFCLTTLMLSIDFLPVLHQRLQCGLRWLCCPGRAQRRLAALHAAGNEAGLQGHERFRVHV